MTISVIICTYNPREEYLRRTLEGLQKQTLARTEWELLLIDNASEPPLAGRVDLAWHPASRQLQEPTKGKLNAWRLGMREARGEVLTFVDDDNVLAPDYLEQALAVGAAWPFVGAWGGSIIPEFEVPVPAWVGDQIWRLTVVDVRRDVWSNLRDGFATFPVGAGLCIRRRVASRYLEWCSRNKGSNALDRSGKAIWGYGDHDLCQCAMDVGLGTGRSTKLSLTHLVPQSRLTLDYFVRHAEDDATSLLVYLATRGLPFEHYARQGWFSKLVWGLHCLKRRVPWEQRQIHSAHCRGIKRGLPLARAVQAEKATLNHV